VEFLDHIAVAILVALGDPLKRGQICVLCLVHALHVERWLLLKSVRELITVGRVLCMYEACSLCRRCDLVLSHRRPSLSN
jgi:hypothetical protein